MRKLPILGAEIDCFFRYEKLCIEDLILVIREINKADFELYDGQNFGIWFSDNMSDFDRENFYTDHLKKISELERKISLLDREPYCLFIKILYIDKDYNTDIIVSLYFQEGVIKISITDEILIAEYEKKQILSLERLKSFFDICKSITSFKNILYAAIDIESLDIEDFIQDDFMKFKSSNDEFFSPIFLLDFFSWFRHVYVKRWENRSE